MTKTQKAWREMRINLATVTVILIGLMFLASLIWLGQGWTAANEQARRNQANIAREQHENMEKALAECAKAPGCNRPMQIDTSFQGKPVPSDK